jgi:hypothetical protein
MCLPEIIMDLSYSNRAKCKWISYRPIEKLLSLINSLPVVDREILLVYSPYSATVAWKKAYKSKQQPAIYFP